MILTFDSCPTSPLGYLLGNQTSAGEQRQTPPRILGGDPEAVEWLTVPGDGIKNRFLNLSLSWSEDLSEITEPVIEEVCSELNTVLHAGFGPAEVPEPLFVLHTRRRGCDVHQVYGQVHLPTGRPISLARFPRDAELFRVWRDRLNIRNGWTSPGDNAYWWIKDTAPEGTIDETSWRTLDRGLKKLIRKRIVQKRSDTVAYFVRCGTKVVAQFEQGMIVELPTGEQVRFRGEKYSPGFDLTPVESRVRAAREYWRKGAAADLPSLDVRFGELLEKRAVENRRIYPNRTVVLPALTKGARIRISLLAKRALREQHRSAAGDTFSIGPDVPSSEGESLRGAIPSCHGLSLAVSPELFSGESYERNARPIAQFAGLLIRSVRRAADGLLALGGVVAEFSNLTTALHRGTGKLAEHARELLCSTANTRVQFAAADSRRVARDGYGGERERGHDLCSIRRVENPPPELSIPLAELRRAAIANGRIRAEAAGYRAAPVVKETAQAAPVMGCVVSVKPGPAPLVPEKIDQPRRSAKGDGSVSIEADDELMGR